MFQKYKDTFYKVNFDFDDKNISIYDFHSKLGIVLAVNGIFLNNKNSKLRFLWPSICVFMSMVGLTFMTISTLHYSSVNQMSKALEASAYLIVVGIILVIYPSLLLENENLYKMLAIMEKDFKFVSTADAKFRKLFFRGQLLIWKFFVLWCIFLGLVAFLYSSFTFIELTHQQLFAVMDQSSQRPLIFPLWLPDDVLSKTPYYEIFLFLQCLCIADVVTCFGAYVYMVFHLLQHIMTQLDIVIQCLEGLFDGLVPDDNNKLESSRDILRSRMKDIVDRHMTAYSFADHVQKVYGAVLSYQVLFSSILICLMMYQVADDLDHGQINFIFMTMLVGSLIQLWIPCYLGSLLESKASDVGDACFFCGWHSMNIANTLDRDIQIFIMRANRPLQLKARGLSYLSLETFNKIVSSAYSYFNMLRQANSGI